MLTPETLPPNATPTDRFGSVIDAILILVRGRHRVLGDALVQLIWRRLRRLQRGFNALAERVRTGRAARVRTVRPAPSPPPAEAPARADPGTRLPTAYGWLRALLGHHASGHGCQLQYLLMNDPEMMALIAADPGFGRVLRPLFAMLAVWLPPSVPPPPRRDRKARARSADPPRAEAARAPRPVRQVTGRALRKYLPWKKPRPVPEIRAPETDAPAKSDG